MCAVNDLNRHLIYRLYIFLLRLPTCAVELADSRRMVYIGYVVPQVYSLIVGIIIVHSFLLLRIKSRQTSLDC